jgi:hypothetical protein
LRIDLHDDESLVRVERLRAVLASYSGHLRHGSARRNWAGAWGRRPWLSALFERRGWRIEERWPQRRIARSRSFRDQYRRLVRSGCGPRTLRGLATPFRLDSRCGCDADTRPARSEPGSRWPSFRSWVFFGRGAGLAGRCAWWFPPPVAQGFTSAGIRKSSESKTSRAMASASLASSRRGELRREDRLYLPLQLGHVS